MAVKLTINDTKLELPSRLSISQWEALLKWDYADVKDWPYILACVLETDAEQFKSATLDSMTLAISFVIVLMNARAKTDIKDFNTINFGEFVDLDIWITNGVEKHIDEIIKCLQIRTPWSDEALWIIEQYQKFRVHTYRSYATLFGLNDKPEDRDEEDLDDVDPQKIAKGWYRIIVDLADNDVLRLDAITEQPLKKILNFMSLRKELQLEENFKQLQQKRQNDLSRNRK